MGPLRTRSLSLSLYQPDKAELQGIIMSRLPLVAELCCPCMHCTVLTSEEVTHAGRHCSTSQMQGRFTSEAETGQLEKWADEEARVCMPDCKCECVIVQGIISGHKDAAETLI